MSRKRKRLPDCRETAVYGRNLYDSKKKMSKKIIKRGNKNVLKKDNANDTIAAI